MFSPIEICRPPSAQEAAWYVQQQNEAQAASRKKDDESNEESEESIAWKRRAQLLLEEGRAIYGSDAATQSMFGMLVSEGEEARLKRIADLEARRVRTYAAMSPAEAWFWASFRGVYLYMPIAIVLWFGALTAGVQNWQAVSAAALFVALMIWARKRWMDSYARQHRPVVVETDTPAI